MDSDRIWTIVLIVVLIMLSAYFSASETAFTSANRIRLRNEAKKGNRRAERAEALQGEYSRLLSTILVGNNIVNIGSSAIATVLFISLFPSYGATISTVVMTIIVLIFGEITPKAIAKERPEKIAKAVAPSLNFLMKILRPINWFFEKWNGFLSSRLQMGEEQGINEEELLSLVDEAEDGGALEDHEHRLIRSAIEFNDWDAHRVLTPRVDVVAVEVTATDKEIQETFEKYSYSRLVIYDSTIDNVIGVLLEKDFNRYLREKYQNNKHTLAYVEILKEVLFVPPMMKLPYLLNKMQATKTQMTVVTDEHGGMLGIITTEDIVEELVGEIWDESDEVEEEILTLEENQYRILGRASLEKVFQILELEGSEQYHSNTISGFVTEELGRFPLVADSFEYQGICFNIKDLSGSRVIELEAMRIPIE